ncbi:MAG: sialate O-acetylesterase, partial [Planctomycetota bacterium]
YQGEANRHRHAQYARLFPAMIVDWRAAFGRELPFYFVQLAPFGYDDENTDGGLLTPLLREAQAAALLLKHTGMAVTLDCGDARDIHPIDKAPVGKRLAALARHQVYREDVPCLGPTYASVHQDGKALRVSFTVATRGLVLRGTGGFELAGDDGRFVPATPVVAGDDVVLTADGVDAPRHVRYAFAAVPQFSLWSGAELPAAPFRASIR